MMPTSSERLAAVEQRLTDHEARCEERLAEIKATAASTLRAVEGLRTRSWGLVAALLAWAMAQVWTANTARLDRLEALNSATFQEASHADDG
jgi:hypothetical protein